MQSLHKSAPRAVLRPSRGDVAGSGEEEEGAVVSRPQDTEAVGGGGGQVKDNKGGANRTSRWTGHRSERKSSFQLQQPDFNRDGAQSG